MTVRPYFTLCARTKGKWFPEFGDYDRREVASELSAYRDDYKRSDLKIIRTADSQPAIDAAVAALNAL